MKSDLKIKTYSQMKRIGLVFLGSLAVASAISVIALVLSIPLGFSDVMVDFLFGEKVIDINLGISVIVFPVLWKYMKT